MNLQSMTWADIAVLNPNIATVIGSVVHDVEVAHLVSGSRPNWRG